MDLSSEHNRKKIIFQIYNKIKELTLDEIIETFSRLCKMNEKHYLIGAAARTLDDNGNIIPVNDSNIENAKYISILGYFQSVLVLLSLSTFF